MTTTTSVVCILKFSIFVKKMEPKRSLHENLRSKLTIHIGPMSSSKTQSIMTQAMHMQLQNIPYMIIRPSVDTRSPPGSIQSFTGQQMPCTVVTNLLEKTFFEDVMKRAQVFFMDESQFFGLDLIEFCIRAVDVHQKCVRVFGLSGDSERHKFGHVLDLIPHADDVEFLHGFCSSCNAGKRGIFSIYTGSKVKEGQLLVGNQGQEYKTVCRECANAHAHSSV
jgi:thymidine kinase